MLRPLLAPFLLLLPFETLSAQSFQAGDLYLHSPAITGIGSGNGALVRIDPVSGQSAIVIPFAATDGRRAAMAYDPHRQALVFQAVIGSTSEPKRTWFSDAQGHLQSPLISGNLHAFAPTGDGRIYFRDDLIPAGQVEYLDVSNQRRSLLDASGTQPFEFLPGQFVHYEDLHFHAATNSLFAASTSGIALDCNGTRSFEVVVRRVALSLDGTRAIGNVTCASYEVSSSGEWVCDLDELPGGDLLLTISTNSNAGEERLLRIDPVALTVTPFATTGPYLGAAALVAGCWSSALGKAVILDSFTDALRAYGFGESGPGTMITTSGPISANGSSGEIAALVEVEGTTCAGSFESYGQGHRGTGLVIPALTGQGCPMPGGQITLNVSSGVGGAPMALGIGSTPTAIPLFQGTLLVVPQVIVNAVLQGTPGLARDGHAAFPSTLPHDVSLSGQTLYVQALVLDPGAPGGFAFTPGLAMTIG